MVGSSAALQCDLSELQTCSDISRTLAVLQSDSVLNRLLAASMSAPQQRGLCDHELLAERGRSVTLLASYTELDQRLPADIHSDSSNSHLQSITRTVLQHDQVFSSHHHISHTITFHHYHTTIFLSRDISYGIEPSVSTKLTIKQQTDRHFFVVCRLQAMQIPNP